MFLVTLPLSPVRNLPSGMRTRTTVRGYVHVGCALQDIVPDLMKSLLGRWTTAMMEQHGYVNWYECNREVEMLLEAGEGSSSCDGLCA